jgi:glycosyltransferase involved in cell wall biosynthesis
MKLKNYKQLIVVPVYEDRQAATRLFGEIAALYSTEAFLIAVDDGSVREPIEEAALRTAKLDGAIIRLKRNVGHQKAIAIGLSYLSQYVHHDQAIIVMDSDGEDLPASIAQLVSALDDPQVDIAVAQRRRRVETLKFKSAYVLYKLLFKFLTGRNINFGNFMAMKAAGLRRLAAMQELPLHLAATALVSKLRIKPIIIDRGPRYAGRSKMNFVGLVLHAFRALMVFAEDVLVRVGILCAFIATLSVLFAMLAVILKLIGFATPGWFSVALGVLIIIFLQTGALALMTLILTGIVRSDNTAGTIVFNEFIDAVSEVKID